MQSEEQLTQSEFQTGIHVAVVMDGNGRWATRHGLPRVAGHRAGVATARRIVEHAPDVGIRRLTLYAFSSDNWRRPAAEVQRIFWLLRAFLRLQTARMREQGVRLQAIGRRDRLPEPVLRAIEDAERATAHCRRLDLRVAIDYSAREAIARAAALAMESRMGREAEALGSAMTAAMTAALEGKPGDVDLLIRTGGEKRLSDFLLWESAYAELYFTERMWPEFDAADLDEALDEFHRRERRFGSVPEPVDEQARAAVPAT